MWKGMMSPFNSKWILGQDKTLQCMNLVCSNTEELLLMILAHFSPCQGQDMEMAAVVHISYMPPLQNMKSKSAKYKIQICKI